MMMADTIVHQTSPEVHDGSGFREYQQGMYMFDSGASFDDCKTEAQRRGWLDAKAADSYDAPDIDDDGYTDDDHQDRYFPSDVAEDESFEDWQDRMSIRNEPGWNYNSMNGPQWA